MDKEQAKQELFNWTEEMKSRPIPAVIETMAEIRAELDQLKERTSYLNKRFDALRLNALPEMMDEQDVSTITVDTPYGKKRISLMGDVYFSILAANKESAYNWLRDNGHEDLVIETVNASSGKAWAKEMIKQGEEIPEIIKATPYTRAQLTSVK